jgi:hypothetical protein
MEGEGLDGGQRRIAGDGLGEGNIFQPVTSLNYCTGIDKGSAGLMELGAADLGIGHMMHSIGHNTYFIHNEDYNEPGGGGQSL